MLSIGTISILLGAVIGTRCRILAMGVLVGVAGVGVFVASAMSGCTTLGSIAWATYTTVLLQLGYTASSFVVSRISGTRKSSALPACGPN